jgi:hypothetical protein
VGGPWSNFTTQAGYINNPCPLQVMVKDIRLNNERGSHSLFADSDARVVACIDPLQNQFTFTQKMYDLFANLTEHPTDPSIEGGTNFTQQTFPLRNEPLIGNLTVELSNGYTTVIPHYEFVSQERGTDAEGKYAVVNESRIMVAAGTTGTSSLDGVEVLILGGVYLSQNYLFVDYESGLFHLAPAVVGPMNDHDHNIVKVCGSSTFDSPASSSPQGHQVSKSNAGAIAGGVVGGLAVAVAGLLTFWCLRNKKKAGEKVVTSSKEDDESAGNAPEVHHEHFVKMEAWLDGVASPVHRGSELESTTTYAGITGSELDGSISPHVERKNPIQEELISPISEPGELEGSTSPRIARRESELEANVPPIDNRRHSELEGSSTWR